MIEDKEVPEIKLPTTISEAMDVLRKGFIDHPDYAHSWHCNIAMACYDNMNCADAERKTDLEISNDAATRFMKLAFGIETSNDMLSSTND